MDFVKNLHNILREYVQGDYSYYDMPAEKLAELMVQAADQTLVAASQGESFADTLSREQVAYVSTALMWNYDKRVRRAIKH